MNKNIIELSEFTEYYNVVNSVNNKHKIFVIDFYASWCGPCKQLTPDIVKLAQDPKFADAVIVIKINIDEDRASNDDEQQLSQIFSVEQLPSVVIVKNNIVKEKIVGNKIENIKNAIVKLM